MTQLIYQLYTPNGVEKNKNISNSSRLVLKEAEKFGMTWRIIPCTQIIELNYKGKKRTYYHQVPSTTSALAKYACNNKKVTSNLLLVAGVSVPKGFRVKEGSSKEYLRSVYDSLQKPLVVKPGNGSWGENITVNVTSFEDYLEAVRYAFSYTGKKREVIIVEEMFEGNEYRILVTREKVIGVLHRRQASVVGNGKDTVKKLIKFKNDEPIRSASKGSTSHLKIRMDERMFQLLQKDNMDFSYVPKEGERVFLRRVSNITQGGDAIDFTDKIHPSVREIALQAINTIPGLSFAGVDFLTTDITKKQTKGSHVIIEINDSPGFDIHDYPYEGKKRNAAREFIFLMFPELREDI